MDLSEIQGFRGKPNVQAATPFVNDLPRDVPRSAEIVKAAHEAAKDIGLPTAMQARACLDVRHQESIRVLLQRCSGSRVQADVKTSARSRRTRVAWSLLQNYPPLPRRSSRRRASSSRSRSRSRRCFAMLASSNAMRARSCSLNSRARGIPALHLSHWDTRRLKIGKWHAGHRYFEFIGYCSLRSDRSAA